ATIGAIILAVLLTVVAQRQNRVSPSSASSAPARLERWSLLCLLVPPVVYGVAAVSSRLGQGVRHLLPGYPFFFIAVAVVLARTWQNKRIRIAILALGVLLIGESLLAYPNYIAFFNLPARIRGGIALLGDSNLDWGQDLSLLARWRLQHRDTKL